MNDRTRFGAKQESNTQEQTATQTVNPQQNFTQQTQGVNMQQPQQPNIGHSQINNVLRRSGKQTQNDMRSGMALKSFLEVQKACESNQTLERGFGIIRFDRDQYQVGYASIVVIRVVDLTNGTKAVFARPIMIENKALRLPARTRKINQNGLLQDQIECITAPQDIFTSGYWDRMVQCVRNHVGSRDIPVYSAGGYLLPNDIDVEDTVRIESVLLNTVNRIDDAIGRFIGEQPFSLSSFKTQGEILAVDVHHSDQVVVNSAGHPERADIMVTLKREMQHQNQQQQNEFYDSDNTINQLYGYVDLEYSPEQSVANPYGQPQVQRPPFQPVFVITGVRQAPWINASTIELFLYALSNAYRVTQGHQWARSFMPVPGKTRRERDIGAIGYLMNQTKAPTNTEQFTDEHFNALMTAGVRQQLTFAIDLNTLGDNSHIDSILLNLMSPNNQQATNIIRQATTNLFGAGVFEQFFKFDKPILSSYPTSILAGYYLNAQNERRDRRDFDVLAALNATNGNQMEFMNWYRTVCDVNMDAEVRLKNRDGLDRQYLGNNLTTTGKLQRGLFNPDFMVALANAVQATGIGVNMNNVTNVMGGHQFVGNAMVSNFAVTQPMSYGGVQGQQGVGVMAVPGMSY